MFQNKGKILGSEEVVPGGLRLNSCHWEVLYYIVIILQIL